MVNILKLLFTNQLNKQFLKIMLQLQTIILTLIDNQTYQLINFDQILISKLLQIIFSIELDLHKLKILLNSTNYLIQLILIYFPVFELQIFKHKNQFINNCRTEIDIFFKRSCFTDIPVDIIYLLETIFLEIDVSVYPFADHKSIVN